MKERNREKGRYIRKLKLKLNNNEEERVAREEHLMGDVDEQEITEEDKERKA